MKLSRTRSQSSVVRLDEESGDAILRFKPQSDVRALFYAQFLSVLFHAQGKRMSKFGLFIAFFGGRWLILAGDHRN